MSLCAGSSSSGERRLNVGLNGLPGEGRGRTSGRAGSCRQMEIRTGRGEPDEDRLSRRVLYPRMEKKDMERSDIST